MQPATFHRNIFQRIFGICATKRPLDEGCWTFKNGRIIVDLARAPELSRPNGAIRLETRHLPDRVLVIQGNDGRYYSFRNRCKHLGGRRLDPVPGTDQVQCCSIGKSTYDYEGKNLSGPAKEGLESYPVTFEDGKLVITLIPG